MKKWEGFQKGVNLGGWLSQFDTYSHEHFQSFITEKDIADIASLGFDHVRVPVDYTVLETEEGLPLSEGFGYLENCHAWCKKHGLNMLIDLHECFGYSFDPLKPMDRKRFFYDDALQERFLSLWRRIAEKFGAYPGEIAFEPLNEVVLFDVADAWNTLIRKYIAAVRPLAPETVLVVGGVCYNNVQTVKLLEKPSDPHIVFNFHCYDPKLFTHQGAYWVPEFGPDFKYRISYPQPLEVYRSETKRVLKTDKDSLFLPAIKEMGPDYFALIFKDAVQAAETSGVPLYCGEYGVIDLADNPSKIRWLHDIHTAFRQFGIGHALWNYKEKDFGFTDERFSGIRDEFMACL